METFFDHQGLALRLTDERLAHILDHPEMIGLEDAISETLKQPEVVIRSAGDPATRLYYRFYSRTPVGGKFVCVVVKEKPADAFVLTAYLTDKPKKGTVLWTANA